MSDKFNAFFKVDSAEEWLDSLPEEKENLTELLKKDNVEEAASLWVNEQVCATLPSTWLDNKDMFLDKSQETEKEYFHLVKMEVQKLLCGDKAYEKDRDELHQLIEKEVPRSTVIAFVSGVIGAQVGLAATLIAPAIVIIFILIGKIALNAWCNLQKA